MKAPNEIKREFPLFLENLRLIDSIPDEYYNEIGLYALADDYMKDVGEYWLVAITDRDELSPLAYGRDDEPLCDWTFFAGVKLSELEPSFAFFMADRGKLFWELENKQ